MERLKTFLPIGSLLLSIVALGISTLSYCNSKSAREDARAIAGLDLKPNISLLAIFEKSDNTLPFYVIANNGPVDALQVEIRVIYHRYKKEANDIKVSITGSDKYNIIPRLPPLSKSSFKFPDDWDINAKIEQPPESNITEIRISYKRPSDLKQYTESAFYFVNKEGRWVPENDSSLDKNIYDPIKKAMLANFVMGDKLITHTLRTDILHNVKH